MRTKNGTSAAKHEALQCAAAYGARFACFSVNLQERGIAVICPLARCVVFKRNCVFFGKIRQLFGNHFGEAFKIIIGKRSARFAGVYSRGKKYLIGVDIANSGDDALVEQHRFDGLFAASELVFQICCGEGFVGGFRPELFRPAHIRRGFRYVPNSAETAYVCIAQLVSVVESKYCMGILF